MVNYGGCRRGLPCRGDPGQKSARDSGRRGVHADRGDHTDWTGALRGTTWIVSNQTTVSEGIPAYAIVLAIIFFLACLLGLLFLLIKERKVQGFIAGHGPRSGFFHATQVPVSTEGQIRDVEARVNYIRGLVASLG